MRRVIYIQEGTLILALLALMLSSIVSVGYGVRACMQRQKEHAWEVHARADTLTVTLTDAHMMQACDANDDVEMMAQAIRDRAEALRISAMGDAAPQQAQAQQAQAQQASRRCLGCRTRRCRPGRRRRRRTWGTMT